MSDDYDDDDDNNNDCSVVLLHVVEHNRVIQYIQKKRL
jgi:hypothetical protein